ncbi:MAG: penicillin-binding protein 1C [Cytophagaceae bacterium]|nr:penicillin-binding protein 1C [Cytophagaceae bacterium]
MTKKRKRRLIITSLLFIIAFLLFWFSLPSQLFNSPYSTILEDEKGELLGARIAEDGQWRFPRSKNIPVKFKEALLCFEDKNFYSHPGVDLMALGNAIRQNIKAGKVVRGGSTLTMQVIRLSRNKKERTFFQKFIESVLALRMEMSYSKDDILKLYMSEAPFGGNVVGLEAASWRYFGQAPDKLSWAESATLAVLPNSPSLIFPGKNQQRLKVKRDRLLLRLKEKNIFDETTYKLSIAEPVPGLPHRLPNITSHLLNYCEKQGQKGHRNTSTINISLQKNVNNILKIHHDKLIANGIHNSAALVLEVETGKVLTYAGNILQEKSNDHGYDVDIIQARRSTGSILKPLLFAMVLNEGKYLPKSIVPDIPTLIGGYAPKNYFLTYDGAVTFQQSISRSLNVPAVKMLQDYGMEKFHINLKKLGMTTLNRPANHYGLSLILGGAEGTLWDLASIYRNLAWSLNHYHVNFNRQVPLKFSRPIYLADQLKQQPTNTSVPLDPGSIWLMLEAMNEVSRPEEEAGWKDYASAYKIAWKTGTSFGYRDGWAIGCTPQHVVAVWVGNADGEGRPELTGISTAAPIMFDIFKLLKSPNWFMQPFNDMTEVAVCRKSGYKTTELCEETDTMWVQKTGVNSPMCPYHKLVYLDPTENYRVTSECESVNHMKSKKWFVLPPAMEYYFKMKNSSYKTLPPFKSNCLSSIQLKSIEIIYPQRDSRIYVPIGLDGQAGKTVFEVAHRNPETLLFWYLDNFYLGSTKDYHQIAVNPEAGIHKLTVTDELGESREVTFEVISEEK